MDASQPPPIAPVSASGVWDQPEHLLLWVRTGSAVVRVEDDPRIRITRSEGVWIPMKIGDRWTIVSEPGSVVIPLLTPPGHAGTGNAPPTPFPIPEEWQDWLIHRVNLSITPLASHGFTQDALADLLRRAGRRTSVASSADGAGKWAGARPGVPKSGGARDVAVELLQNPALDLTIEEWANRVLSSSRTLLRDFRAGTGLTFEQWRLRCRLAAAVEHLAAGDGVQSTAAAVGFATTNGLTRAFSSHFGLTPQAFSRHLHARRAGRRPPHPAEANRQADDLLRLMRATNEPAVPDTLPAARTPSHANTFHVLIWTYRGSGYVDIGDRRYEQERGVATWIPAGSEHVTGVRENSISLALGNATTRELQLNSPVQVRFSAAWDDYLLFCSISARTPVRPADYDPARVRDVFTAQVTAQRALSAPMPTHPRARGLAMDYLRTVGSVASPKRDVPAEVHRAFRDQTGMTFARWRYAARMRIARDLLLSGAKPTVVSRQLGYAHLPTFSAAFSRFHGLSPRDYQERETA